jgi:hypothetical protein
MDRLQEMAKSPAARRLDQMQRRPRKRKRACTRSRSAALSAITALSLAGVLACGLPADPAAAASARGHAQGRAHGHAQAPARTSSKLNGFQLGVDDSGFGSEQLAPTAIARSREIGAAYARAVIVWGSVAPVGAVRPAGFDARDPADPQYRWSAADALVKRLSASGMTPYVMILGAPRWAQQGTAPEDSGAGPGAWRPNAAEYGAFAHAAATRYNGTYPDPLTGAPLPRVKIWQAWNEPNLPLFLAPTSPELYRGLLNSFYDEVKAVQPDATVVSAGLAPVKSSEPAAFPKEFALRLLCLKPDNGWFGRDHACAAPARMDIFSVHPYSLRAKPLQRAAIDGNLFVADVVDIAQMVRAAVQLRAVLPAGPKPLWSTEFAWFTTPPNTGTGDSPDVAARRTLVALYTLWRAGLSQVTWFATSDNSAAIVKGGGFYYANDTPKPTRDALRFPFYVSQTRHKGYVWGRAPLGAARNVLIQRRGPKGYRTVLKLRPRADGLFSVGFRLKKTRTGLFRARQADRISLPLPSAGAGE